MRKTLGRKIGLVHPGDPPVPASDPFFERTFPATSEAKTEVLQALLNALSEARIEFKQMWLCLEEALVNAVMHGSKYDASKNVEVRAYSDGRTWSITVSDEGPGFREEDLPDPDALENLLEESGRGVNLIRTCVKNVSYWRNGAMLLISGEIEEPARTAEAQSLSHAAHDIPLQRRVRDLESILSITRAMAAESDLTRLLLLLAKSCSTVLEVERTSIWVIDPRTGDLMTRVAEGVDALRVPKGKGLVGAVADSGEVLLIPDAYADARFNPEFDKKTGFRTRQILCMPLKDVAGSRTVGVIQAINKIGGQNLSEYDVELASIIAAQAGVVLDQAALREEVLEKKRLQAELDLAHTIQQRLLPREQPNLSGLDIAGTNRPATETSGDYFDYTTLPDGRLAVIIADVTGHGLGAALVMTAARAFVRALCGANNACEKIVGGVNDLLERDLEQGNFLSLCLAAFDPTAKTLSYTSAGHDPPLVYRPGEDAFAELESTGPLLGIIKGIEFEVGGPLPLVSGDILVFMTDGLFECMNDADETFGKDKLRVIIKDNASRSANEILAALLKGADDWTGDRPPRDDITVVVVKVTD